MIARDFAAKYGSELAGLVICGTPGVFRMTDVVAPKIEAPLPRARRTSPTPPSWAS